MTQNYGQADATFQAVGGEAGVRKLVDSFYDLMDTHAAYQTIRNWHPEDLTLSRDKLSRFLCGWMGGPRLYQEKYGSISIPGVHAHLAVGEVEKQMWLDCMTEAMNQQDLPPALIRYLGEQLSRPADMIQQQSAK